MHEYFQYFCIGLFVAMVVLQVLAYHYANSRPDKVRLYRGSSIEAALFALLGLLIAFTFAGAQNRFEGRRQLIVDEVNAISTAFLQIDTLSDEYRKPIREKFIKYVDTRLNFYPMLIDRDVVKAELSKTESLQRDIWSLAVEFTSKEKEVVHSVIVLPSLNRMFDVVTKRTLAAQAHTSPWVFFIFAFIALICSTLAGFRMARQGVYNWNYSVIFALAVSVTLLMIFDIEFPRYGFIRLEFAQQALSDLKKSMIEHMNAFSQ